MSPSTRARTETPGMSRERGGTLRNEATASIFAAPRRKRKRDPGRPLPSETAASLRAGSGDTPPPMWKGRFQEQTAPLLQTYSESISFDWRLWRHDIAGSIAHSAALQKAGLLTAEEREKIVAGLNAIGAEIEAGKFQWKTELEDVHMNIEAELTNRIGDAGAKLHTARSRNDQIALDIRLFLRDACDELDVLLAGMQRSLVDLGVRHRDVIIPGYTHLQRAQPVYFAHHLLAYVEMFQRDRDRVQDARKRINVLPLGSGAIAGSTIVLDRELIA